MVAQTSEDASVMTIDTAPVCEVGMGFGVLPLLPPPHAALSAVVSPTDKNRIALRAMMELPCELYSSNGRSPRALTRGRLARACT
jgi:hypothetical protein